MEADDCGAATLLPYEELLGDAMEGNQTWFAREDYVEESWRIIDPVLANRPTPYVYEPGSWGPEESEKLIETPAAGGSRGRTPTTDANETARAMRAVSFVAACV